MLKIKNLKIGDILVAGNYEKVVQNIIGKMVFLSYANNYGGSCSVYTIDQLNHNGYKPKSTHPEFEVDQPLMVRDFNHNRWKRRLFACYKDGEVYCWGSGCTEWTAGGVLTTWNQYRLPTPEELEGAE